MEECCDYALRTGQAHGVWGALNEAERRRVLRMRDLDIALARVREESAAG